MAETAQVTGFLSRLVQGGEWAYYWVRSKSGRGGVSHWWPVSDGPTPLPGQDDIYIGVHPLRSIPQEDSKGNPAPPARVRGRIEHIQAANHFYAEFDAKNFTPWAGAAPTQDEVESGKLLAMDAIKALPIPPSAVVDSGGGYHCYWFFRYPVVFEQAADAEYFNTARQHRWVEYVGGDLGAKDISRVLRVPGTINAKAEYKGFAPSGLPVELVEYDTARLFDVGLLFDAMDAKLGPAPSMASSNGNGHHSQEPEFEGDAHPGHDGGGGSGKPPKGPGGSGGGRGRPPKLPPLKVVREWLSWLLPERADAYEEWLRIGMSLREFGDDGLKLWDEWSRQSKKYKAGTCKAKWADAQAGNYRGTLITWKTLKTLAAEDKKVKQYGDKARAVPPPPQNPQGVDYINALTALGYSFRLNEVTMHIEVNERHLNDYEEALIRMQLRDFGYTNLAAAKDAWMAQALKHSYHPIKTILEKGLPEWDGESHIARLSAHFTDKHGAFGLFFRKWLIGAVARVYEHTQNPMLVLEGPQGIGKSYFVAWLSEPFKAYFTEGSINPDNKDHDILLFSKYIWEVSELGASIRKSDREKLKDFLSKSTVTVRPAYARNDITMPALACFIGTVNNEAGYLNDPTGYRRFMPLSMVAINHAYSSEMDAKQVWAEALAAYRAGEEYRLTPAEREQSEAIAKEHEVRDPVYEYLDDLIEYTGDDVDVVQMRQIIHSIQAMGSRLNDDRISKSAATYLKALGCPGAIQRRLKPGENPKAVWPGIRLRDVTSIEAGTL